MTVCAFSRTKTREIGIKSSASAPIFNYERAWLPPMSVGAARARYRSPMPLDTTTRMLAPFLNRLSDEELDSIPYGVIQLDPEGFVVSYNRAEAENAGYCPRPIGRHFFREVAPSANAPEFHGRFLRGVAEGRLDETFNFTYHCDLMPRRVQLRLYLSPQTQSVWLFVAKPDGTPLDWPSVDLTPVLTSKYVPRFTGFAALNATVDALLA
ncbi:MAG TPA: hypothetical protein DGD08_11635 [Gemmatimonas aurantiaca]|uniref:PAS fold-4 domain-containing protein n=1 Tax=Gemmatimonas aurantiaca TaxID=173480 RepID=A0A3D4V9P0_9BACT|nr:hypothetical protein [Gemmatimonas aurantiaca]